MTVTLVSGLTLGAMYSIVAVGLVLGRLPTGAFNFAQGAIVVAGSYCAYLFVGTLELPTVLAVILTILVGLALGAACEAICIRPLRWQRRRGSGGGGDGETHTELITTVGGTFVIIGVCGVVWGYDPLTVPFNGPTDPITIAGARFEPVQLILVVLAVALALALHLWSNRSSSGQAVLAAASDREAATLRGINVNLLSIGAWAAAGGIGALAGMLTGPITFAFPTLATLLVLPAFVALGFGGFSSFLGAAAGGFVVGLIAAFSARYLGASYQHIMVLVALLLVFAVRPGGFGGTVGARSV